MKEVVNETGEFVDNRPVYVSNKKPRDLELRSPKRLYFTHVHYYCWNENLDECPEKLNEYEKDLADVPEQVAPIGLPITLYFETYFPIPLPLPAREELYIYDDGIYIPIELSEGSEGMVFDIPEEEGTYTYVYKAIFDDEDAKGIAFYVFNLRARHMDLKEFLGSEE